MKMPMGLYWVSSLTICKLSENCGNSWFENDITNSPIGGKSTGEILHTMLRIQGRDGGGSRDVHIQNSLDSVS